MLAELSDSSYDFATRGADRIYRGYLSLRYIAVRYKQPGLLAAPRWLEKGADRPIAELMFLGGEVGRLMNLLSDPQYDRPVAGLLAADLTPLRDGALAVGYLGAADPLPGGELPPIARDYLARLGKNFSTISLGQQLCPRCSEPIGLFEWEFAHDDLRYRISSMGLHLIAAHGYYAEASIPEYWIVNPLT